MRWVVCLFCTWMLKPNLQKHTRFHPEPTDPSCTQTPVAKRQAPTSSPPHFGCVRVQEASVSPKLSGDTTRLTWVTMIFSALCSGVPAFSAATFPFSTSSLLSGSLVVVLPSCTECERIAAMDNSTWKCKKLFHVYLKNKSWKKMRNRRIHSRYILPALTIKWSQNTAQLAV